MLRPDLADRIEHLRDVNPDRLRMSTADLLELVNRLPIRITRTEAHAALKQISDVERGRLERMFSSHDAPPRGYTVRDVVLFGLAEMERARRCLDLLKAGNPAELGRLMSISHDGDRVSKARGGARRNGRLDEAESSGARAMPPTTLAECPGGYGCSVPEVDRIVDIARVAPGVAGAQLAGAGLGGCVMVLVQKTETANLLRLLGERQIAAEVFTPIAGACTLRVV
jgi:N-acetylgalactosamine kinase